MTCPVCIVCTFYHACMIHKGMMCAFHSESLFKAVISTSTQLRTAKTISTLHGVHYLNLAQYKNVIILDDDADAVWCKHDMMNLKLQHKVNVQLIQVPHFDVWVDVFRRFRSLPGLLQYGPNKTEVFYDLIAVNQQTDQLFLRFHKLLESMNKGGDSARKEVDKYSVLIPNQRAGVLRKYIKY